MPLLILVLIRTDADKGGRGAMVMRRNICVGCVFCGHDAIPHSVIAAREHGERLPKSEIGAWKWLRRVF